MMDLEDFDIGAFKRLPTENGEEENGEYSSYLCTLPWQRTSSYSFEPMTSSHGNASSSSAAAQNEEINPGEFVLRALFTEFTVLAERKIERLMKEPVERSLSKSLQRGEDPQFDQLLSSLSSVAEHCLSSLLKTLFQWYDHQTGKDAEELTRSRSPSRVWGGSESPKPASRLGFKDKDALWERRDLAVEFIFCLVLIEVLKQLSVHPVEEHQVQFIENLAFKHFKDQNSGPGTSRSQTNRVIVTALYAEVIGVLALTRFQSVRKRFMQEYKENIGSSRVLVNIIMGLKFIRIKLFPVEELEESFLFLQECATLFLERNLDKEVKYAFASLFVEILIPVAATAKREYSIPAIKKFVDMLHKDVLEMARKARHSSAMYPLVTALLCISQKQFFLTNWNTFLTMCLSHVRSRDTKNQRMAMECLYRLLWVYVIRVKCENHAAALTRLRSITETLFPKSSRTVVPRNIPLNIFVKIIQFIAQEKLDFAMQEIIFDLLNVGRSNRQLNPERMNIGLRAFLVIADNLQRKEGTPPMPSTIGVLPSGNTLKVKKTFSKLTEQAARSIGVVTYYTSVRRALDLILRTLDVQVGRPMTMNNPQCSNKEAVDMITGERKPKIDLFRTCVAAIPKCVPDGMSKTELVELVSRLTLHVDEELRGLAFTALQSLIMDFPDYREEVVLGYINFTLKEVPDVYPSILESSLRVVLQLIIQWKTAVSIPPNEIKSDKYLEMSMHSGPPPEPAQTNKSSPKHVLHSVEGFALVLLCSTKAMHRKLALQVLKEVRSLAKAMNRSKPCDEVFAIDIIEECASSVIEKALNYVSGSDKTSLGLSPLMDLQLLAEKSALLAEKDSTVAGISRDVWAHCFAGFLERIYVNPDHCFCTLQYSWPFVHARLFNMYTILDPSVDFDSISSRASISVKAPKKPTNMPNIWLWRNYLIFACCAPPKSALNRPFPTCSQEILQNGNESKNDIGVTLESHNLSDVFRSTVPLIKSESQEIREATVTGLGKTNAAAHAHLIEEMSSLIRVVLDRNAEGVRKKKKRDLLRLQVARVLSANAEQGCFKSSLICDEEPTKYVPVITEYIDGMRYVLEQDNDKDDATLIQLRFFFSKLIHKMIKSIPPSLQVNLLKNQSRHNLFLLLASWCGHFHISNIGTSMHNIAHSAELEFSALEAMCALVCCGEVFDQKALEVSNGYLYKLLDTMLGSDNAKVHSLGQETVELLLENNERIPALLSWVIDRCYTGSKGVSSGCFLAVANVFCKRPYSCRLVPLLCVVLYKTGDGSAEIRERAAQLLHLLDRRFFSYMVPFRAAFAGYSYNQQNFSRELAMTHPELTLPLLAEMTFRFESTSMVGQRWLLHYQLPWLENVELVNTTVPLVIDKDQITGNADFFENGKVLRTFNLEGAGWGSVEASQMVLNNLFYITAKYDEYFSKEIEAAWAALCGVRETNVQLIIEYLILMAGICGSPALPHVKKVAVYVARANPKKTIDELMDALKLTETVSNQYERMEQPPYYRFTDKVNSSTCAAMSESCGSSTPAQPPVLEAESEAVCGTRTPTAERQASEERSGSFGSAKAFAESVLEVTKQNNIAFQSEHKKQESGTSELWPLQWMLLAQAKTPVGVPLPMPEESRYFAPITYLFPLTIPPANLYRCNFGVMLLTEIVSDRPEVQWIIHLPLMLHVSFLGLDHMKPLVHEHCKRLLINLVVVLVCRGERSSVAKALLDFQSVSNIALDRSISVKGSINAIAEEGAISDANADANEQAISEQDSAHRSTATISQTSERERVGNTEENGLSVEEKARELIEFLTKSDCKPLWPFEDITPRNTTVKSAEQLKIFLRMVISIFEEAVPHAHLLERWGYEALHWATSCSSRHYAGRSFQMFRGLHTPLTWTMLSDVLQRLVESVADSSDDVQGYVMEILLTFLSAVDCAFSEPAKPFLEDYRMSDMSNQSTDDLRAILPNYTNFENTSGLAGHSRSLSTDFDLGYPIRQRSASDSQNLKSHKRYASELILPGPTAYLMANVPSLKEFTDFQQLPENPLDMLARLFWAGVSLLESDFEHEFLMAIRLLEKVLDTMDLTKSEGLERVERISRKLNWPGFPGVQSLLLKGLTSSVTADPTLHLLAKLTTMTRISIIDPSPASGLSLNILALLPMLVTRFDDLDEMSKTVAANIAKACERDKSLSNLGKIMLMYKDGEYSKPQQTWIEVVCKYILDVFPRLSTTMLALLVEILEQGPAHFQQPVLNMICAILKYSDATSPGLKQFHGHLLKVVTAHVKDVNLWKDSLSILKLVVSNSSQIQDADEPAEVVGLRSSDLVQPRASIASLLSLAPKLPWGSSLTLADNSWSVTSQSLRKELPGRTLQFTYDVQATPLIGAKFNHGSKEFVNDSKSDESNAGGSGAACCWRRPYASQKRTRERLVQLLPLCGHKGTLKASLSVIFSSSSDLAVESKQGPSSGEASGDEQGEEKVDEAGFSGRQLRNVFTEFDFLDDELDKESEDMNSFGWTSTTELRNSESIENLGNMPSPSRSESEEDLREMKEDELTDEEESDFTSSLTSTAMTSLKEDAEVDEDEEESERDESPVASVFEVRTNNLVTEKPEPSPASLCSAESTIEALDTQMSDVNQEIEDIEEANTNTQQPSESSSFSPDLILAKFDEIPSKWASFLATFISAPTDLLATESLPYFPTILIASCYSLKRLTRDCCGKLQPYFDDVYEKFAMTSEILENQLKVPYIFVDHQTFKNGELLSRHKIAALKLDESVQMLHDKREHVLEQLESLHLSENESKVEEEAFRFQFFPEDQGETRKKNARLYRRLLDLGSCLYRLHLQFIMCLEIYQAYLQRVCQATKKLQAMDLSAEYLKAQEQLDKSWSANIESSEKNERKAEFQKFETSEIDSGEAGKSNESEEVKRDPENIEDCGDVRNDVTTQFPEDTNNDVSVEKNVAAKADLGEKEGVEKSGSQDTDTTESNNENELIRTADISIQITDQDIGNNNVKESPVSETVCAELSSLQEISDDPQKSEYKTRETIDELQETAGKPQEATAKLQDVSCSPQTIIDSQEDSTDALQKSANRSDEVREEPQEGRGTPHETASIPQKTSYDSQKTTNFIKEIEDSEDKSLDKPQESSNTSKESTESIQQAQIENSQSRKLANAGAQESHEECKTQCKTESKSSDSDAKVCDKPKSEADSKSANKDAKLRDELKSESDSESAHDTVKATNEPECKTDFAPVDNSVESSGTPQPSEEKASQESTEEPIVVYDGFIENEDKPRPMPTPNENSLSNKSALLNSQTPEIFTPSLTTEIESITISSSFTNEDDSNESFPAAKDSVNDKLNTHAGSEGDVEDGDESPPNSADTKTIDADTHTEQTNDIVNDVDNGKLDSNTCTPATVTNDSNSLNVDAHTETTVHDRITDTTPCIIVTEDISNQDLEILDIETAIAQISEYLSSGQLAEAIQTFRQYRASVVSTPTDVGQLERDSLSALLARSMVQNRTSVFILSGPVENLADICDQLSECMVELFAAICGMEKTKC